MQTHIFKNQVCILFLLPHVLGHEANDLPEHMRHNFLSAISLAQQLIIAARGNRAYTEVELEQIFNTGFVAFFRHVENMHAINSDLKYQEKMAKHRGNPDKYRAPKRFKKRTRFTVAVTRICIQTHVLNK